MTRYIDGDTVVTIQVYDDMTEETSTRKMTIAEAIDEWSDEGCPPTIDTESLITQHEDIGYERGYRDGYAEALEATDDAEPVRHGCWYDEPNYLGTSKTMYFCSYCGSASYREDPYCWHCGAKMEGKNEQDI